MAQLLDSVINNHCLSNFEKTNLIGTYARQISLGKEVDVKLEKDVVDAVEIATQAFYEKRIPLAVRRFVYLNGERYHHDISAKEMYELDEEVDALQVLSVPPRIDMRGAPARYTYLTETELDYVVTEAFRTPVPGLRALCISLIRGMTTEIQAYSRSRLAAFIRHELRGVPVPNSVADLIALAQYAAYRFYRSQVTPQQSVGVPLADSVVETQGVISAFHNAGQELTSLQSLQLTASLVKGKTREASDHLVFERGEMDPYLAVVTNRRYSEVKLADVFVACHPVAITPMDPLLSFFLRRAGRVQEDFGTYLLSVELSVDKLTWHRLALESVCRRLRRLVPDGTLVVPGPQSSRCIRFLISVEEDKDHTLLLKSFELNVLNKVLRKAVLTEGVRGVSAYKARIRHTTSFIVKETPLPTHGNRLHFLWTINRQEMELLYGDHEPFPILLEKLDPDAQFTWVETGETGQPYSYQARVSVRLDALRTANDQLLELREVHRERFVERGMRVMGYSEQEAVARIAAKQLEYQMTPMHLLNALGMEYIMGESLDMLEQYDVMRTEGAQVIDAFNFLEGHYTRCKDTEHADYLADFRSTSLITQGSNYPEHVRVIPHVDPWLSVPLGPQDAYHLLGVEATRVIMLRTFVQSFCVKGKAADPCHIELICDVMTASGCVQQLDSIDDNETSGSTLQKASRGRAAPVLRNASVNEEVDAVPGVLMAHLGGTRVIGGTGGSGVVDL